MSHLMRLEDATTHLGLSSGALHHKKYDAFRIPAKNREAYFDMDGYEKYANLQEELLEKTKLLVEYLYHIEGMTYANISRLSGVKVQSIHLLNFSYQKALKIALCIREFYPFHFKRFDEYYSYRACDKKKFKLTVEGWVKKVGERFGKE